MLDSDSGAVLWEHDVGDYTFIFTDDQIYAGSQNSEICSLDIYGNLNWGPVNVGSRVNGIYVDDGILTVASDELRTYDCTDGDLLDTYQTSAKINQAVMVADEILAGADDGTLYRFDNSPDQLWGFHTIARERSWTLTCRRI